MSLPAKQFREREERHNGELWLKNEKLNNNFFGAVRAQNRRDIIKHMAERK